MAALGRTAVLVLLTAPPTSVAQPDGLLAARPTAAGRSTGPVAKIEPAAEDVGVIEAVRARWKWLREHDLSFTLRHNNEALKVWLSPRSAVAVGDSEVLVLSDRGGFHLVGRPGTPDIRLSSSVSDRELETNPSAMRDYYLRTGLLGSGLFPYGGPFSDMQQIDSVLNGRGCRVVKREETGGRRRYTFELTVGRPGGKPDTQAAGHVVTDPAAGHLVREHTKRTTYPDGSVETAVEAFDYHPPGGGIPYPTLRECVRTTTRRGGKPATAIFTYSDYKLESVPSERLRLSYYQLPDEIVVTRRDYTSPVLLGVSAATLAAALVLSRRSARRQPA